MDNKLKEKLISIARERISNEDPSHDIHHALRVMKTAENIAIIEKADLDVVIPSALFHDVVNHPKDDPRANNAPDESAVLAAKILNGIKEFPKEKIEKVREAIRDCSFSKGVKHKFMEAQIVQDADGLESTGAISIMRTFCSTGQMKRPFYHIDDPFCKNREPESLKYALDLFYYRLLKVKDRMYTKTAKEIAERRTKFLHNFLEEFETEIEGK